MKIWDKIKNFLGITKKEPEPAALPPAQNPYTRNQVTFTRVNGTQVSVTPIIDQFGNQLYKQINKANSNEPQLIPRYTLSCDELQSIAGTTMTEILIDTKSDILKNPDFSSYFANNIFSKENIDLMFDCYEAYFGEFNVNPETDELLASFNRNIVNDIKAAKKAGYRTDNQRYEQNHRAQTRQLQENAINHSFSNTLNQAQILTSCPYGDER